MKITKSKNNYDASMVSVNAAENDDDRGTIFYSVSLEDAISYLQTEQSNLFLLYAIKSIGWDALDIDQFYGGAVLDNVLYMCDTDGSDIDINGQRVSPDDVLLNYDVADIQDYIEIADSKFVKDHITIYEMKKLDSKSISQYAKDMLNDDVNFDDVVDDYAAVKLIKNRR